MKAIFTFDEMVYNTICKGKTIHHDDGTSHVIKHVKLMKETRQVQIHAEDGEVFLANQDEEFEFEVTEELVKAKPTKRKLKRKK